MAAFYGGFNVILEQSNWHWSENQFITHAIRNGANYAEAVAEYQRGHNSYAGRWSQHVEEAEMVANEAIDRLIDHHNMAIDKRVLSWGRSRVRSWGGQWSNGRHGLTLAMKRHVPADHVDPNQSFTFHEYRRFAHDPNIGTFKGSWQDCVRVLVAHEYAHALEPHDRHNRLWKLAYAKCRSILV